MIKFLVLEQKKSQNLNIAYTKKINRYLALIIKNNNIYIYIIKVKTEKKFNWIPIIV